MAALPRAVLQQLDPVRIILLVLARRVVPLLALRARELDDRTRLNSSHGASLRDDADDGAGTDGAAALADGEALADLEGDRGDQLDRHLDVVAGHDHLRAARRPDGPGDVGRAQVELRPVPVVERGVAAALLLGQDVDLRGELRVGRDRAALREHLAALDVVALDAPQEAADVVAGLARVEQLLEHLDAGDDDLAGRLDADDLDLLADLDHAALDAPGGDRAAALDAEHVLDRHQERLVDRADRVGDVRVDRVHQLLDRGVGRVLGIVGRLERLERGAADDRDVVTREVVLGQQLADLELDEVEQLGVVDHVDLVEEHDDERHLDLAGEQDVLPGLGHRAVGRGDDEDRAVHLRGAGDHVLDVVGVPGAVDVRVVAGVGLVLDVGDRDRDPALALLGRVVDRVERAVLGLAAQGEVLADRGGERRLAVVDVADRADVDVRLVALELLLGHRTFSLHGWGGRPPGRNRVNSRDGAQNGIRTRDLILTKDVLCQLRYLGPRPALVVRAAPVDARCLRWSRRRDSNPEPAVYKTAALPIELRRHARSVKQEKDSASRGMIRP